MHNFFTIRTSALKLIGLIYYTLVIVNRPGVAGAFLQTASFLIKLVGQWVILFLQIFRTPSLPNHKSQRGKIFSHVSPVTCHVSHVICHMSHIFFFYKLVKLVGGGSVINGANPFSFFFFKETFFLCPHLLNQTKQSQPF